MEEFAVKIDTEIPAIINEYEMGDISTFRSVGYIRSEVNRIDASFAHKHAAAEALLKASRGARNAAAAAAATAAGGAGRPSEALYQAEHHSGVPSGLEGVSGGVGRAYGGRRRQRKQSKSRSRKTRSKSRRNRNRQTRRS